MNNFLRELRELPKPLVGPTTQNKANCEPKQWRGVLLDSARTVFKTETIIKVLHLMKRYGFNRLHWHLTDDAGWRFSVPGYPNLTEVGAKLPRSSFQHYHSLKEGSIEAGIEQQQEKWRNGFYSDNEIEEIVETARRLNIEIMPEIDLPGHMKAAIKSYPQIGRPQGLPLPKWGRPNLQPPEARLPGANDLLWPNEKALEFLKKVLTRVIELFPYSEVIHIGGDECALYQWETDPDMQQKLNALGLADEAALQNWFMNYATQIVHSKGRNVGVWDEVCELNPEFDGVVFAWEGEEGLKRIKKSTQRYVFADCRFLYLNRVDPNAPKQLGMVPEISLADILTAPMEEFYDARCIGMQASTWAEFILDEEALLSHLFPRLLAVAERLWNPEMQTRPVTPAELPEIVKRIENEYQRLCRLF